MLKADAASSVVGLADNQPWKRGRVPLFHLLRNRFCPSKLFVFIMNVGVISTLGHITDLMSVSRAAVSVCMLLAPVTSIGDKIYKRLSVIFLANAFHFSFAVACM